MINRDNDTFLIVGVGNTLRGDDGIGAYICSHIDKLNVPGIKTLVVQQLDTELLETFMQFDHIILADATLEEDTVVFYPLKPGETFPVSSSHHVNAGLLASLAEKLFHKDLSFMICAVKGEHFDMGEHLSVTARQNADAAIGIICDWIEKGCS